MALPLRFGILAPQVVPYTVQVDRWRELEAYGFDSLWFADHFVNPARPSGRWFESYTLMGAAEAIMNPGPVQRPRPPLTLAAGGPVTMKVAARQADSWNQIPNTMGGGERLATAEACLDITRSRNARMDGLCAAVGRDPGTLRRSILAGGGVTPDAPWSSPEAFRDFVGRYMEAGVNEFIFYYPSRVEQADGYYERIAREVIPTLKQAASA